MAKQPKANNTVVELEMDDGSVVRLTLAYRYLMQLSAKNRAAYDEYNASWRKKEEKRDEFDNLRFIYTGYLCAAIMDGTFDDTMTWQQFLDAAPIDREAVGMALMGLIAPKRKGASATPSE